MAKMLMGQIDHARNRIQSLVTEKLGPRPSWPTVPTEDDFKEGIRQGNIAITPGFLRNAIDAWADNTPRLKVVVSGSRWNCQRREYDTKPLRIESVTSGKLDENLAYTYFQKKYEAAVAVFESELFEYNRREELIKAESVKVEDAIVLGDNAAALAALKEFAAFSV